MKHDDRDPEFVNFLPALSLSRRDILATTLATGFALAVQPISAETIATDAEGLVAGEIRIPVADGELPGYRAMPAKGKNFPVVLVVQEIFGVHEHIKDLCRRFAKAGYFAVATELYARQGDVSKIAEVKDLMPIVASVPDAQVMSDLDATVAWAKSTGSANVKHLAITGFCWGGRIVWLYAAHSDALKAGVAWYGRIDGKRTDLQPAFPIDVAGKLKAPVLGLYGGLDKGIPQTDVDKMRQALTAAGSKSDIIVFPEAEHGFNADYRPSYNPAAAKEGWARALAWFKKYGAA
ncbi:MAG TPA: dienelactone hydrolase family protein [Steroidobacteraceae bacterium]|nr:dienelactone hydrolase family protein [Steroidobacteraceae bacterium]